MGQETPPVFWWPTEEAKKIKLFDQGFSASRRTELFYYGFYSCKNQIHHCFIVLEGFLAATRGEEKARVIVGGGVRSGSVHV